MTAEIGATSIYQRGEIWMVDFGNPVGTELGMEHPGVIVSTQSLNKTLAARVIVVPGTSTPYRNAKGQLFVAHQEAPASTSNGLAHTTYFMTEQVRSVSTRRLRRLFGRLEQAHMRAIEDRLCLVLDLFKK